MFVPEEAIVGTLPEGRCGARGLRGISLERIGEVVRIGEAERVGIEVAGDQVYEPSFIGVLFLC